MTENGRKVKVTLLTLFAVILVVVLIISVISVRQRRSNSDEGATDEVEKVTSTEEMIESTETVTLRVTADLNQDGFSDLIRVYTQNNTSGPWESYVQIYLGLEGGNYEVDPVYRSEPVGGSHWINGIWALTEKDGKNYLLYSQMYEMQGSATYTYSVMCINGNEMTTIETNSVDFLCDPFNYRYWEETAVHREDVIPAFKSALDLWTSNAYILAAYDVSTPTFLSTDEDNLVEASAYYNSIWERNESESLAEFERMVGTEEWRRVLYWSSNRAFDLMDFVQNLAISDVSDLYSDYDGSKLQTIENDEADGTIGSYDIIYYKAARREDESVALNKMMETIVIDYEIQEYKIVPVTETMWLVTFEDQGDDEAFIHVLINKDDVYRLERLQQMMD